MKTILVYVSLFILALLSQVRAGDIPEGVEVEGNDENKVIQLSVEKAKREGWLPWEKWYDDEAYENYKQVITHMFKPIASSNGFYNELCKNITWMSEEKYAYYIRDWRQSVLDANTTTVLMLGGTHFNSSLWAGKKIQESID